MKADLFVIWDSWRHQLPDRVEHNPELTIILAFEFIEAAREFGI